MAESGQKRSLVWDRGKTYELFAQYRASEDPEVRDELDGGVVPILEPRFEELVDDGIEFGRDLGIEVARRSQARQGLDLPSGAG